MHKRISLILILILIPFLVSCFPTSQASLILNANFKEQNISNINPVLIAGNVQYFNVTTTFNAEKIIIIAYHGDNIPEPQDRSIKNYYRWEYDFGLWKDVSDHDSLYIKSSKCLKEDYNYSFYIGIDNGANPGRWTIKVIVDDTEVSSISSFVIVTSFNFFLSSIIGVFEPNIKDKKLSVNSDLILSDRKRIMVESENNIEKKIDRVLRNRTLLDNQEKEIDGVSNLIVLNETPSPEHELIKLTVATYPRSRLRELYNASNSLFFNNKWEGKDFFCIKIGGYKKLISIILTILLLSGIFLPIITSTKGGDPPDITIINVQSYPVVGGEWMVMFTTVGRANLTISAVNGTTWSNTDENQDLKFIDVKTGNETLEFEWVDNSVFIANYSSNETGYKTSKVLTLGSHTLIFKFGNDIAYAYNDASNWWNASWNYRKLITLNSSQVNSDLTNFPVLVYRSSDSDLANDSKCQNDGDDITFVAYSDNTTKLNHEIEKFNGSTGEIVSWVNVTSLSSSIDTKIWMYYGNSASSNQENPARTWDSNYVAVWHFHNDSLNDSTSNGYNGINNGTVYNVTSKIAGGREYRYSSNHRIDVNNFATISTGLTAEIWVYRNTSDIQPFPRLFTEGTDWNSNDWCFYWRTGPQNMRFVINSNDYSTSGSFPYLGTWFHTAVTYDTGDAYLYKNGALEADWSGQYGSPINNVYDTLSIGNQNEGGRGWNGTIDEVRISNKRRSTDWLNTSYNSMNSPATFLRFGNEYNVTETSVNKITPYNVTYSPLSITVAAASGLDNITLWYRYSTDNSSWDPWMENITDILAPWEWGFEFPNGTGYYEFYSIGKKSGLTDEAIPSTADAICFFNKSFNTAPAINLISPAPNGTTGVSLQPLCQTWANDSDGDSLNIYWYENSTGPWVLRQTNSSISANSTVSWQFTQANVYNTKYWWKIAINDSVENTSAVYYFTTQLIETSVNKISPYIVYKIPRSITASGNSDLDNVTLYYRWSDNNYSWVTLTYDDFEAGFGNYTDGGDDCYLYTGGYAHQGSNAAGVQDASGVASSFYHTSGIDVQTPGYLYIKVEFWFQAVSMENGEDFWLRYYDGTSWSTVATYVAGTDFVNDQFYHETIWINESVYTFPNNMQLRFQCDASSNFDDVYIDQVWVNATGTNWIAWSNTSNPDSSYPWGWDFNFPNGTGYYEFYSIGKKTDISDENPPSSADTICYYNPNPPPIIELISPANGGTGISLQPTCNIKANDPNGDNLNIYWYENTTGSWILRQTNSSIAPNSTVRWAYSQANGNGNTYWWRVSVNDSVSNTTSVFYFKTVTLNTSVNSISPYIVFNSPLDITATGSADLDNVTIYYRWSETNFSWVKLSYDDFEDTSGDPWTGTNYTDGGIDCLLYTDGTYAHQGSNAANIQDNNGIASSFYHTSGIDVHTPEHKYIKVEFWFQAVDMENGEDFRVRYFDGTGWSTVASYVAGTDFVNDQFYHETIWINESIYTFPNNMQIRFQCDASSDIDDIYIDQIYVNATPLLSDYTTWTEWNNPSNPDITSPWNWSFDFPISTGYYEFYSIGKKSGSTDESPPSSADAKCYYYVPIPPIINAYNLINNTGSKLNNLAGLLDVNNEYYFTINITAPNGWDKIEYINITTWYDDGSDSSTYNQTLGGNLNMYLQYENTTGIADFKMLWPDDEVQFESANCSESIYNSTTRIINISFRPLSQVRWASSNNTWDGTQNVTNDPYSWNFNVTVEDFAGKKTWIVDEYGVYRYTSILPNSDWVDVVASPGFSDTSNIVTITYETNYNFNMSIYFEENLTNITWMDTIPIANNVWILAATDPNDDITSDKMYIGIEEINAIDIFNISGIFSNDSVSQTVNVQFSVDIPFGTHSGEYTARVATKIAHD